MKLNFQFRAAILVFAAFWIGTAAPRPAAANTESLYARCTGRIFPDYGTGEYYAEFNFYFQDAEAQGPAVGYVNGSVFSTAMDREYGYEAPITVHSAGIGGRELYAAEFWFGEAHVVFELPGADSAGEVSIVPIGQDAVWGALACHGRNRIPSGRG